jgi:hypothetical protein
MRISSIRSLAWAVGRASFALLLAAAILTHSVSPAAYALTGWATESSGQARSLSLEAAADSYVHSSPAELQTVNYGGASYLKISSTVGRTPEESSVAYVMFDLSELPPGAKVSSATLYLYRLGVSGDLPPDRCCLAVRYVDDIDWTEYGITWLKAPAMRLPRYTARF